jgi:hypothetical protein
MTDHNHGHDHDHNHEVKKVTTLELLRMWLQKKIGVTTKQPAVHVHESGPTPPVHGQINTLAIVMDGVVQEVIRAENRMTALMLSEPEFVLVPTGTKAPTIGWYYKDGEFTNPHEED